MLAKLERQVSALKDSGHVSVQIRFLPSYQIISDLEVILFPGLDGPTGATRCHQCDRQDSLCPRSGLQSPKVANRQRIVDECLVKFCNDNRAAFSETGIPQNRVDWDSDHDHTNFIWSG